MAYSYDKEARYAETHDWVRIEDDSAVCGVSDFAQHALSDVVYVELPQVGASLSQGQEYSTVESVKAAEPVYAPLSGEVIEVNEALEDSPELINEDPYGKAWIIKMRPNDLGELDNLMDAGAYEAFIAEQEKAGGH